MASDEAIAAADVAKAAANKLYAENKLDEAIQAYTHALQLLPELDGSDEDFVASLVGSKEAGLRSILLTNRAQCLLMQVRDSSIPCALPPQPQLFVRLDFCHQGKVLVSADGLHSSEARKLFMKVRQPLLSASPHPAFQLTAFSHAAPGKSRCWPCRRTRPKLRQSALKEGHCHTRHA
jgi:hypothetical protein